MNSLDSRSRRLIELREQYLARPFDERHLDDSLEDELDFLGRDMLDNPPVGKSKGLLPGDPAELRTNLKLCRLKEVVPVIPVDQWGRYLESNKVDVEKFVWFTLDQDGVGSCAAESLTGTCLTVRRFQGQPDVMLNPWGLYHYSGGGVDHGSTLQSNLRYARAIGITPESMWPRERGYRQEPSAEAIREAAKYRLQEFYEVRDWEEFGSALLYGWPVYFGYDSHAVFATQLLSQTTLEFKNSWGKEWGRDGFGVLHSSRIQFAYGAYAIRVWTLALE